MRTTGVALSLSSTQEKFLFSNFGIKNGIHPILGKNGNLLESHKTVMGNSWEIKMPQ